MVIRSGLSGSSRGETTVDGRSVSSLPSRCTTTVAVWSPLARISCCTWAQLVTGVPLKETIRSPGSKPAAFAGATGSAAVHSRTGWSRLASVTAITHFETVSTVVVAWLTPYPEKTKAKSTNASTRLIATPEPMMITRFHQGLL